MTLGMIEKLRARAAGERGEVVPPDIGREPKRHRRTWLILCPKCNRALLPVYFADDSLCCDYCREGIDA